MIELQDKSEIQSLIAKAIEILPQCSQEQAREVMQIAESLSIPPLHQGLFDKQKVVYSSKGKRITLVCGRRGGKTTTAGRTILKVMEENPAEGEDESICVFGAPTKNQARRLMWGRLQALAEKHKQPITFSATQLIATHANGSQCWIMGLDDARDIERLRGFAYRLVWIDESQSLAINSHELVDDILEPALADYDGQLIFSGTPNAACKGFFYQASTGQLPGDAEQYENHTWTVLDNPMFPRWRKFKDTWRKLAAKWLSEYRKKKGWSKDNPVYLREWMARWVRDASSLIYKYLSERNGYDELPDEPMQYVIGVDLGYDDAFTTVVLGFHKGGPHVWHVDEFEKTDWIPAQWAEHIRGLVKRYKPVAVKVDTGGLGKAVVKEFVKRYNLPVSPAEKKSKHDYIAHCNSDFHEAYIRILRGSKLEGCLELLQWDEDRKKESPGMHHLTNLTDAFLYAWREAQHWLFKPTEILPEEGTKEHWDRVELEMFENRKRSILNKGRKRGLLGN